MLTKGITVKLREITVGITVTRAISPNYGLGLGPRFCGARSSLVQNYGASLLKFSAKLSCIVGYVLGASMWLFDSHGRLTRHLILLHAKCALVFTPPKVT